MHFYMCRQAWRTFSHAFLHAKAPLPGAAPSMCFGQDVSIFKCAGAPGDHFNIHFDLLRRPWDSIFYAFWVGCVHFYVCRRARGPGIMYF